MKARVYINPERADESGVYIEPQILHPEPVTRHLWFSYVELFMGIETILDCEKLKVKPLP